MSSGLVVIAPDTVWVAEDHVVALATFLSRVSADIERIAQALGGVAPPAQRGVGLSAVPLPFGDLAGVRRRLHAAGQETRDIEAALWRYASDSGDQERARARLLDRPRDWLVAVSIVSHTRNTPSTPIEHWGIAEAAWSLLPPGWQASEIAITAGSARSVEAPVGLSERVRRIPEGPASVRVERFGGDEGVTEVYIAGTRDFGLGSTSEPFDMESNIALTGGLLAASLVAVEAAMRQAGVRAGDKVVFTGHSQGGLIAVRLAESGRYDTQGLVTVGAPGGTAPVRGNYPAVALTHSDDVVPHLGGARGRSKEIRIERPSGQPTGNTVAAHALTGYVETAAAADSSPAAEIWGGLPNTRGRGQSVDYTATRG